MGAQEQTSMGSPSGCSTTRINAPRPRRIWTLFEWARRLAVLGILSVAAAVVVTWWTPTK
jgi:hypothetical protein